jgi:hypothetical protein
VTALESTDLLASNRNRRADPFFKVCWRGYFMRKRGLATGSIGFLHIFSLQLKPSPRKSCDKFIQAHA